jgi:hypothetical protein
MNKLFEGLSKNPRNGMNASCFVLPRAGERKPEPGAMKKAVEIAGKHSKEGI